jgi:hypothetical protein
MSKTSRSIEVCIKENLTQGLLEKSKLAQHAYEENHKICWKEAKVLQIKPNGTYRKCKESEHMVLSYHPISHSRFHISPIWTLIIAAQVSELNILANVHYSEKYAFSGIAIQRICGFSEDFGSDSILL